ncbi:hypothetical protein PAHAL_5G299300 [Panicum hallii]|uniref:Uncharacterized protein n=1 Tax=Panicum hallii TaxID=206008 RepID=A0A2T8ILQ5_9POAL|nr:hypothetical protein PAHAL_5G299300 [Panicum hallii]
MQSAHGPPASAAGLTHSKATQLHSNPAPKEIIHTRSPFLIRPLASAYASSYSTRLLDVFPNRCNVIRDASTSSSDRPRPRCTSSITARPPAWMQKCSNAVRKSGRYSLTLLSPRRRLRSFRLRSDSATRSCSETGRTSGPKATMFLLSALPAVAVRSFERRTPRMPLSSSSWKMQR